MNLLGQGPRLGDLLPTATLGRTPRGGDELNLIKPGKNYGFPLISYGRDNDGKLLVDDPNTSSVTQTPVVQAELPQFAVQ